MQDSIISWVFWILLVVGTIRLLNGMKRAAKRVGNEVSDALKDENVRAGIGEWFRSLGQ